MGCRFSQSAAFHFIETNTSVQAPIGDFFGIGHGVTNNFRHFAVPAGRFEEMLRLLTELEVFHKSTVSRGKPIGGWPRLSAIPVIDEPFYRLYNECGNDNMLGVPSSRGKGRFCL